MARTDSNSAIFIDASAYLYFYQAPSTKELLPSLQAQKEHVFVTQQIVDEVNRNKLEVAAAYMNEQLKNAKPSFNLPKLVFDEEVEKKLRTEAKAVGIFHKAFQEATLRVLDQISRSEDEVSTALACLFVDAAKHSNDELARAQKRKLLGNPPGKAKDPIGDELNWEQLLTHVKGKSKLWIITRDTDYFTKHEGQLLLNPALRNELGEIQVRVFDNLSDGINDFAKATGEGRSELPTQEKLDEIKKEEEEDSSLLVPFLVVSDDDRFVRRLDPRSRFAGRLKPSDRFNRFGDREGSSWILTNAFASDPSFASSVPPPESEQGKPEEPK